MATGPDLRALFSGTVGPSAQEVFKDRDDERAAFDAALKHHLTEVFSGVASPSDHNSPRRNVLVFYGMGGVGKSTLSEELEDRIRREVDPVANHWPSARFDADTFGTARIDLSHKVHTTFEDVMLALRIGYQSLGARAVAFDVAFARYWGVRHPGEALGAHIAEKPALRRLSDALALPDQMAESVSEFAGSLGQSSTVATLGTQAIKIVGKGLMDRHRRRSVMNACDKLAPLLEAPADMESLSYYAHLLAWDLGQLQGRSRAALVVFVDTFEDVGNRSDRELERLIQRVIWLMPNALFVITGRDKLDWSNDQRCGKHFDNAGPRAWPGLVATATRDPRQHLVGFLSEGDTRAYLGECVPEATASVVDEIVEQSAGWPLWLDVAVMHHRDVERVEQRMPVPADFSGPFPDLVARMFRDLGGEQQALLRAASLLASFDVPLLTATAGLTVQGPAERFVERPLVHALEGLRWPLFVHDKVRETVREADAGTEAAWNGADWRSAALRALCYLSETLASEESLSRDTRLAALANGLSLAHEAVAPTDCLDDAALDYVSDSVWEPLRPAVPPIKPHIEPTPAQALTALLQATAARQHEDRRELLQRVEDLIHTSALTHAGRLIATYFAAEMKRDLGDLDGSWQGMSLVADAGGPLAELAHKGLCHILKRQGRFVELDELLDGRHPLERHWQRVAGDLWWTQAQFARARDAYAASRDAADHDGRQGEAALSAACYAFAAAFDGRDARPTIIEADRRLAEVSIRWANLQVRLADVLSCAGERDCGKVTADLADIVAEATDSGLTSTIAYARFVEVIDAVLRDDTEIARRVASLLGKDRGQFAFLHEICWWWLGEDAQDASADWIDGRATARRRWTDWLADRRRRTGS